MRKFQKFSSLHRQSGILSIGNVWDLQSALTFERMGYKAIGTSSAAIAGSLGYEDGEEISFEELLHVVALISKKASIPLTVDIEAGYSRDIAQIINNITRLAEIGAVGVNLEDSVVNSGDRKIVNSSEFSKTIETIKNTLTQKGIDIFLNIRTDFYLMGLNNSLEESISRAKLYEKSGADGIFVPCVRSAGDIKKLVDSVSIPINVMAMPELPVFAELELLGVKRISAGPFVYNKVNEVFNHILKDIETSQSFKPLF